MNKSMNIQRKCDLDNPPLQKKKKKKKVNKPMAIDIGEEAFFAKPRGS